MTLSDLEWDVALATRGFMPTEEGLALHQAGHLAPCSVGRPMVELGSYCGRSAVFLGSSAREAGGILFSVDHHTGSEENYPPFPYLDPMVVDPITQRINTLLDLQRSLDLAELSDSVIPIVGPTRTVASNFDTPISLLFIDGGHGSLVAWLDYICWEPKLVVGGVLALHDVFEDPSLGGRPPYEIYQAALLSGSFTELAACGSLRILRRST